MAYAEKLVKSWRACWKNAAGKVEKQSGFPTKREARIFAEEQEAEARRRGNARTDASQLLLRDWVDEWHQGLDLEVNTMLGYETIIQNHLLPTWGETRLRDLATSDAQIKVWVKELREAGYTHRTVGGIVSLLGTICSDAVDAGLMHRNPAAHRRSRGRYANRQGNSTRPPVIVDPFTAFLLAERASTITGRDIAFILLTTMYYTGMRISEVMGIEIGAVSSKYRLQKQLSPYIKSEVFYYKSPKFNSIRDIDIPKFLLELWRHQARQVQHMDVPAGARWCPCGDEVPQEYRHTPKIHLFVGDDWHHWKQTSFRHRVLYPAAWGKFFPSSETWRPVYQSLREDGSDPGPFDWDNTRSRRNRAKAAVACWAPLAPDMTPHAFRHSHKTLMEELGTPKPLMNDRMGHKDHSVSGRYSHPTDGMREQLMEGLFRSWEMALAQRRDMGVSSPVRLVEDLLETSARSDSRSTPDLRPRLQIGPRGRVA